MKKMGFLAILFAVLMTIALAACSSGGGASSSSGAKGATVKTLSANAAMISLESASDTVEAEITVATGESYVVAGKLKAGEAELVTTMPEGDMTDYFYEGTGVSETEITGTCKVVVKPTAATGTIYVLSYPTGKLDIMNSDSNTLFDQIAAYLSK